MTEGHEATIEEMRQRVIGMVTEAIYRLALGHEKVQEIREAPPEDLGADRKRQAMGEIVAEARTFATEAVREARNGVDGGWVVGSPGVMGGPIHPWDKNLSEDGQAARNDMLVYVAAAERVFEVDLQELESGEAPAEEDAARRDAGAEELASYEVAHPAPVGIAPARARWSHPAS